MLGRRERKSPSQETAREDENWFSRWDHPASFAAKANDLDALRTAVVDAAAVGTGLWLSYLFVLFYFAIAAGAVTHRDLLLENPVKLPFLNVELPLKSFFILGPLVFLVVHAYVLLHFVLLASKVGAFHDELQKQIAADDRRAQLRRQLLNNIFVQFLSGPQEVRSGFIGLLLRFIAWVSLIAGPILLLMLFQLQFLPYHNPWITWWQRIAIVLDLILLWLLWPPITRGKIDLLAWRDFRRADVALSALALILPVLLVFTIATFPGEWLEGALPEVPLVPTRWPTRENVPRNLHERELKAWKSMNWTSLHELLVAGEVDYVTGEPQSLWSKRAGVAKFRDTQRH